MSYKKLVTYTKNEHLRGKPFQLDKRNENLSRYELCGDDRQYELHKDANEGERIRKDGGCFPYKGKR